ncbi:MAG: tetratricopeptide repeat protein [Alphaproteobacteria bacterium]|nr:tetratricopeptide repeat protein [Alphaproteobacteria bacterium]
MSKKKNCKSGEDCTHDPFQDMLFREIEEDLRMEKLKKIWDKYNIVIFAMMIIVIGAVGGKYALHSWNTYIRTNDSNIYLNAAKALRADDKKLAISELNRLEHSAKTNYNEIAAYKRALIKAKGGDYAELNKIAASKNSFNEVAAVTSAMHSIGNTDNDKKEKQEAYENALKSLEVHKSPTSPWRGTALEMSAIVALNEGNTEEARMNLQAIINDEHLSIKIKERATEMLATLPEATAAKEKEDNSAGAKTNARS